VTVTVRAAAGSAPRKRIVWLEHSAQLMMLEEPGRVFAGLIREALPLPR
jgi:hypothetical protein